MGIHFNPQVSSLQHTETRTEQSKSSNAPTKTFQTTAQKIQEGLFREGKRTPLRSFTYSNCLMGSNETEETKKFAQEKLVEGPMRSRAEDTHRAALPALSATNPEKADFEAQINPEKTKEIVKTIVVGKTYVIEGPVRNQASNVKNFADAQFPRSISEGTEFTAGLPCIPTISPSQFQRMVSSAA